MLGIPGGKGQAALAFFAAAMLETTVPVEHGLADQLLAGKAKLDGSERGGGKELF